MTSHNTKFFGRLEEKSYYKQFSIKRHEKKYSTDRMSHPFLVIVGAPGTGKTRLLEELPSSCSDILLDYNHFTINITFGKGTTIIEDDINVKGFGNFIKNFENSFGPGSLDKVDCFDIILAHQRDLLQNEKPFFVNLGIDEFSQTLLSFNPALKKRYQEIYHNSDQDRYNRLFLNEIINSIIPLLFTKNNNLFNIILAGTLLTPVSTVIHVESTHKYELLHISLLPMSVCQSIAREIIKPTTFNQSVTLHRILAFIGGWARYLSFFLGNISSELDLDRPFSDLLNLIDPHQQLDLSGLLTEEQLTVLVACSIVSYKFSKNTWSTQRIMGLPDTLENLESKGFFASETTFSGGESHYIISIPLVTIKRYSTQNNKILGPVRELITYLEQIKEWTSWEEFSCQYLLVRAKMFSFLQINVITLEQFFEGAQFICDRSQKFLLLGMNNTKFIKMKRIYPDNHTDPLEMGNVYRNAQGAPFDWITFFPVPDQNNRVTNNHLYILGDGKHTNENTGISPSVIQTNINTINPKYNQSI
eukprot:gene9991-12247_t